MIAVAGCALSGCTTSSGPPDLWSRSYIAPIDRVFSAVTDVLEDDGYFVETDRSKDRITAEPPRDSRGLSPLLEIKVVEKSGKVLVDVQTRAGANDSVTFGNQVDTLVVEFFHELELRLQGLKD